MRLLLVYMLSVLLLTAALFQGDAQPVAWNDEPDVHLMGDVLTPGQPLEVMADESDMLDEELRVSVQLYQPPVTNDDRTELFWSPLQDPDSVHAGVPLAASHPLQSQPVWPLGLLRPPQHG